MAKKDKKEKLEEIIEEVEEEGVEVEIVTEEESKGVNSASNAFTPPRKRF